MAAGWCSRRGESYEAYKAELELADEWSRIQHLRSRADPQDRAGTEADAALLYDNTCGVSNPALTMLMSAIPEAGGTVLQASVTGLSRDAGAASPLPTATASMPMAS